MTKEQDTAMYDQPDFEDENFDETDYDPTHPFGNEPNILGTTGDPQYPTVVYSMFGEGKAFSGFSFVNILRFAFAAKKFCDEGTNPVIVFTDTAWNI